MKTIKMLAVIGIMSVMFISGCSSKEDPVDQSKDKETTAVSTDSTDETVWTCSMHPEIRESKPGSCPKCNMKLISAEK